MIAVTVVETITGVPTVQKVIQTVVGIRQKIKNQRCWQNVNEKTEGGPGNHQSQSRHCMT
jgi:hypothetical protein